MKIPTFGKRSIEEFVGPLRLWGWVLVNAKGWGHDGGVVFGHRAC